MDICALCSDFLPVLSLASCTQYFRCEVQVFGSTQHPPFSSLVSVGMPASQTMEGWGGEARKAVDGKTDGIYDDQSCTHTEKKANNWWKVDLQAEYFVSKVIVWNRVDCCSERLAGFTVSLCCPTIECKGESGGLETAVDCHHEKGRYVQVTLARDDFLTLYVADFRTLHFVCTLWSRFACAGVRCKYSVRRLGACRTSD